MHLSQEMRIMERHALIIEAYAEWVRQDGDKLVAAANLLGGSAWAVLADVLVADIADGESPSDFDTELARLHRLLTLELVDDPLSPEAIRFMTVHPDSPEAQDAMLCAEALGHVLPSLAAVRTVSQSEAA